MALGIYAHNVLTYEDLVHRTEAALRAIDGVTA